MARYSDTLRDALTQAPIEGALVSVIDPLTASALPLTADVGGALDNPFVTDEFGSVVFNITQDAVVDLEYYYGGRLSRKDYGVVVGVAVPMTPDQVAAAVIAAEAAAASASASAASADADAAAADADAAQAAASAAQAASSALAAAISTPIYADEPTGRAASVDGAYFNAFSTSTGRSIDVWRRDSSAGSTLMTSYPNGTSFDTLVAKSGISTAPITPPTTIGDLTLTGSVFAAGGQAQAPATFFHQATLLDLVTVPVTGATNLTALVVVPGYRWNSATMVSYVIAQQTRSSTGAGNIIFNFGGLRIPGGSTVCIRVNSGVGMQYKTPGGTQNYFAWSDWDGTPGDSFSLINLVGVGFAMTAAGRVAPATLSDNVAANSLIANAAASGYARFNDITTFGGSWPPPNMSRLEFGRDVGVDFPAGMVIDSIRGRLGVPAADTATILLTIFQRDTAAAGIDVSLPTALATPGLQTQLASYMFAPADLGITPGGAVVDVIMPIQPFVAVAGKSYFVALSSSKADETSGSFLLENGPSRSDGRQRRSGWWLDVGSTTSALPLTVEHRFGFSGYAPASSVASVGVYYADRILAATFSPALLALTTAISFGRNGAATSYTDTARAFTAAGSGNARYDLLYFNVDTLAFGVIAGTAKATGADPQEYAPTVTSAAQMPLALVYVTNTTATVVEQWNLYNGEDRGITGQIENERRRSRNAIPRMRGKIARAAPLYIVGIGDSIQCIANVTTQSGATPNGAVRDIATGASGYLQGPGIVGAPIYSALPVFTAAQLGRTADANGAIYSKLSFMWELVAAIQARTGLGLGAGGIRYDNFSIAGQGAAALYSGGPTAWLNAAIALAPDVIIVNMGINDYGTAQATLLASMGGIITTIRAAGIEVIVMGVANNTAGSAGWDVVTRTLREASEANGAAHVSLLPLYDPRFIGALGVGPLDRCGANRINHPGPREHVQIGAMLSRMVLGG